MPKAYQKKKNTECTVHATARTIVSSFHDRHPYVCLPPYSNSTQYRILLAHNPSETVLKFQDRRRRSFTRKCLDHIDQHTRIDLAEHLFDLSRNTAACIAFARPHSLSSRSKPSCSSLRPKGNVDRCTYVCSGFPSRAWLLVSLIPINA